MVENMSTGSLKKNRIIDTFAARNLQMPDGQNPMDSLSEYSLKNGYGLELRRRRRKKKKQTII